MMLHAAVKMQLPNLALRGKQLGGIHVDWKNAYTYFCGANALNCSPNEGEGNNLFEFVWNWIHDEKHPDKGKRNWVVKGTERRLVIREKSDNPDVLTWKDFDTKATDEPDEVGFPLMGWNPRVRSVAVYSLYTSAEDRGQALIDAYMTKGQKPPSGFALYDASYREVLNFWNQESADIAELRRDLVSFLMSNILLTPLDPNRYIFPRNATLEQLVTRFAELQLGIFLLKDLSSAGLLHLQQAKDEKNWIRRELLSRGLQDFTRIYHSDTSQDCEGERTGKIIPCVRA